MLLTELNSLLKRLLRLDFKFFFLFFFFNDTATTEIYTLSLHDALSISWVTWSRPCASARNASERSQVRSEEHTSELQSHSDLVCRLLLEKKKKYYNTFARFLTHIRQIINRINNCKH